ncbi:FHA domain-containing protein fha2 [Ranunculus cassubicifolius]
MMGTTAPDGDVEAGFAKLQGEDFEYFMQTYSIVLGRNSKKSSVDVDLSSLGGGMNISRHHARIFYDFRMRRFALEVLGKNGCMVEGVLHLPGNPLVKLDSQDLLQIGDKKFYFLLPVRSIIGSSVPRHVSRITPPPPVFGGGGSGGSRKRQARAPASEYLEEEEDDDEDEGMREDDDDDEEDDDEDGDGSRKMQRAFNNYAAAGKPGISGQLDKKGESRSRVDREADNHQLLQLEEKDVVSSVATVLSDLCGPGEWMPMGTLHDELCKLYGNVWHHGRVRRYLTSEDIPQSESKGKPWFGLITLLRKYPEHFVINTRSKGRVTQEFVSLVSLIS